MAVNKFTFNGVDSSAHGLYISGNQTFNSAEKDYTKVSVPGRSGDLLLFNNRYKNVNLNYDVVLFDDSETEAGYRQRAAEIRSWLLSADGYCRLEDTYHPDEFRMASFDGPIDLDTMLLIAGTTTLTFDCKPQRWLKSGENTTTYNSSGTITNPTMFVAKPLIRVYGYGELYIGTSHLTISEFSPYIDLDCEIMDCYNGTDNCNDKVIIQNYKWPELKPGQTSISFTTGITKIEIKPRWWTL